EPETSSTKSRRGRPRGGRAAPRPPPPPPGGGGGGRPGAPPPPPGQPPSRIDDSSPRPPSPLGEGRRPADRRWRRGHLGYGIAPVGTAAVWVGLARLEEPFRASLRFPAGGTPPPTLPPGKRGEPAGPPPPLPLAGAGSRP